MPLVERARMKDGNRRSLVRERPAAPDNSQPRIAGQQKSLVISRQFLAQKNKSPRLAPEGSHTTESGIQPDAESPGSDAVLVFPC